jgi:hypothetical protein
MAMMGFGMFLMPLSFPRVGFLLLHFSVAASGEKEKQNAAFCITKPLLLLLKKFPSCNTMEDSGRRGLHIAIRLHKGA